MTVRLYTSDVHNKTLILYTSARCHKCGGGVKAFEMRISPTRHTEFTQRAHQTFQRFRRAGCFRRTPCLPSFLEPAPTAGRCTSHLTNDHRIPAPILGFRRPSPAWTAVDSSIDSTSDHLATLSLDANIIKPTTPSGFSTSSSTSTASKSLSPRYLLTKTTGSGSGAGEAGQAEEGMSHVPQADVGEQAHQFPKSCTSCRAA